jgi:hypothetical protein
LCRLYGAAYQKINVLLVYGSLNELSIAKAVYSGMLRMLVNNESDRI